MMGLNMLELPKNKTNTQRTRLYYGGSVYQIKKSAPRQTHRPLIHQISCFDQSDIFGYLQIMYYGI